jgi:phosphoribosylanthranilate isomerase
MPTRVKICGITRLEDALLAADLGAAALGFNFYKPSPRYIEPQAARDIVRKLPPFVTAVGVFANEVEADRVVRVARQAGVQAVQLHGAAPLVAKGLVDGFFVIRAIAVGKDFNPRGLIRIPADAFLLDAPDPALHGGTGKSFEWDLLKDFSPRRPVILAGGLTPQNVGRAIRKVCPYAVDVATGVESSPGIKDAKNLRAFFRAVEKAAGYSH